MQHFTEYFYRVPHFWHQRGPYHWFAFENYFWNHKTENTASFLCHYYLNYMTFVENIFYFYQSGPYSPTVHITPNSLSMPQDWSLKIVTSCTTSSKALRLIMRLSAIFNHSVRFLNMFENLRATDCLWDCSRPLRLVVRIFSDRLRLSRSTIHKMVTMLFKAYVQLPGIFDCSLNILEDRPSPPHNRFCSCDCSQSLRLVVRSSKIACDYRARLV